MRRWRDMGKAARNLPWAALALGGLVACEPVPVSGNPLQPVAVERTAVRAPVAASEATEAAEGEAKGFDFDGEDRTEERAADEGGDDPVALQARLLGVDPAGLRSRPVAPQPAPQVAPAPAPTEPAPVEIPVWDPAEALADAQFGVRALVTLTDVQPPRAVIGMPDGSERVVKAGAILEEHNLVVMAIGRDVVQVARVVPEGYYARVDTQTLKTLFPAGSRGQAQ